MTNERVESQFPGLFAFPRGKPSLALASAVQGDGGGKYAKDITNIPQDIENIGQDITNIFLLQAKTEVGEGLEYSVSQTTLEQVCVKK